MMQYRTLPPSAGTFLSWRRLPLSVASPNFMSRMYRSRVMQHIIIFGINMQELIIMFGPIAIIGWSMTSGTSSLVNVPLFRDKQNPHLAVFSIITGSIYMVVMVIEAFGFFAVIKYMFTVVFFRIFAYLSILVTLMIVTACIIQGVVHESFKDTILDQCTNVNIGEKISFTGSFGPIYGGIAFTGVSTRRLDDYTIDQSDVEEWCKRQFDRASLSNRITLPVISLFAAFHAICMLAKIRQRRDSNVSRGPVNMDIYPDRYTPPPQDQNARPPPNMNMSA